jgi:hypothetical protein
VDAVTSSSTATQNARKSTGRSTKRSATKSKILWSSFLGQQSYFRGNSTLFARWSTIPKSYAWKSEERCS